MAGVSMSPDLTAEVEYAGKDTTICGVDEAGRGPWAGPVVAAAVVLDPGCIPPGLDDSKKLTRRRRAALFDAIRTAASVGVGIASVGEIDGRHAESCLNLDALRHNLVHDASMNVGQPHVAAAEAEGQTRVIDAQ